VIIGLSRAIGETAPIVTIGALSFIAFLPPPPVTRQLPLAQFRLAVGPFTAMPIQMFNWTSTARRGLSGECLGRSAGAGGDDPVDERDRRSGCATACAATELVIKW
jgi:hypothetical protein